MDLPRRRRRSRSSRRPVDAAPAAGRSTMTALAAVWAALVVLVAWHWRPLPLRVLTLVEDGRRPAADEPVDHRHRRWRAPAGIAALVGGSLLGAVVWPPLAAVPAVA